MAPSKDPHLSLKPQWPLSTVPQVFGGKREKQNAVFFLYFCLPLINGFLFLSFPLPEHLHGLLPSLRKTRNMGWNSWNTWLCSFVVKIVMVHPNSLSITICMFLRMRSLGIYSLSPSELYMKIMSDGNLPFYWSTYSWCAREYMPPN